MEASQVSIISKLQFFLIASLFFTMFSIMLPGSPARSSFGDGDIYNILTTTTSYIFIVSSIISMLSMLNFENTNRVLAQNTQASQKYKDRYITPLSMLLSFLFQSGIIMYCISYTYCLYVSPGYNGHTWIVSCVGTCIVFVMMVAQNLIMSNTFVIYKGFDNSDDYSIL